MEAANPQARGALRLEIDARDPYEAAQLLEAWPEDAIVRLLSRMEADQARAILDNLSRTRRRSLLAALPQDLVDETWRATSYPPDTVGRLMSSPRAAFRPEMTVRETVEALRDLNEFVVLAAFLPVMTGQAANLPARPWRSRCAGSRSASSTIPAARVFLARRACSVS